jgi:hypothetical protein
MKKIAYWCMLLFIAAIIFSCNKDEDLKEDPPQQQANETTVLGGKATTIEALCDQYFQTHKEEAAHAEKIISVTNEFFAINKQTEEFKNKKPVRLQPIYAYGIDGVAYYEVWFTEDNRTPKAGY